VAAGDLALLADVKSWSGIGGTGTAADAIVARLITAASAFISKATGRSFSGVSAQSEIRDGSGGDLLVLANSPVISVQSLAVGAVPIPAQVADGQAGYFLVDQESLALVGYTFGRGKRNVRVSYTAGYVATPADVTQACITLVEVMYRLGTRDPMVKSEATPASGMVTAFEMKDVPAFVQSVIDKYKRVVA
jgi:hypothetical protein